MFISFTKVAWKSTRARDAATSPLICPPISINIFQSHVMHEGDMKTLRELCELGGDDVSTKLEKWNLVVDAHIAKQSPQHGGWIFLLSRSWFASRVFTVHCSLLVSVICSIRPKHNRVYCTYIEQESIVKNCTGQKKNEYKKCHRKTERKGKGRKVWRKKWRNDKKRKIMEVKDRRCFVTWRILHQIAMPDFFLMM